MADGGAHDGVAVLLMLNADDAGRLAIDGGEAVEDLHVTLGYLAKPAGQYTDAERAAITAQLAGIDLELPLLADVFGEAVFNPHSTERDPCAVVLVQSGELADAHAAVSVALGDDLSTTFPVWIPHVALAYSPDGPIEVDPDLTTVEFDRLILSWGGELTDLADKPAVTREAFAAGYARSTARYGLALTERARMACEAAVAVCEDVPAAAQATLQLGQLEGIWAVIYARREAIEKLHSDALAQVMDTIKALDWGNILAAVHQQLTLNPGVTGAQLATALGQEVEALIANGLPYQDRVAWQAAMQAALMDATAEGSAAGLALIGNLADTPISINWDLAATDAKKALASGQYLTEPADQWIAAQTQGLGYQVSQKIASLWNDQAPVADMETAVMDLLGNSRNQAGVLLDMAIGNSLSQGAFATYTEAGVQYADFVTAGDGRVCPACGQAEDSNSWPLVECPQPGLHVGCRCCVAPSDYQPTSAALAMLAPYQIDDSEGMDMAA